MYKLPFGWWPGHWGLKGKTRERAKAEYELDGYDREFELLRLNAEEFIDGNEYTLRLLALQLKHEKITRDQYDRGLTDLIKDPKQKAIALLELDHREKKVTDLEFEKKYATLHGEPWVTVLNMDFAGKGALEGSFELDWNEQFVEKLKAEGYSGPTPDNIVNQWFMEVCRNVAMEEFDGTGNFTADSEANLDAMKRWSSETLPAGRKGHS